MKTIDLAIQQRMIAMRRDLHQHPELGWHETRTADRICHALDEMGVTFRRGIARNGVVAEIPGQRAGPFVALRADMDALPILEETGLAFASDVDGVMHACGHDGHTSMLLGAAELLCRGTPPPLPLRLIFQPAEETGKGARAMMNEGVLDDVAVIFGGHVDRHFPVGSVVVTDGSVNASSDKFIAEIKGRGGHAARPHETVDAVVVGALLVMSIQTIVSREVNPAHPSVVTVGRFDAGTAANVIASSARLEGSIRAQDPDVRDYLHRSICRIAMAVGQLHGAEINVEVRRGTPAVINAPEPTQLAREAAQQAVGDDNVLAMSIANMGGEDFSYYLEKIPGCYVRFGGHAPGTEAYPAHSSKFDFDEGALTAGAAYYQQIAHVAGAAYADGQESQTEVAAVSTTTSDGEVPAQ